LNAVFPRRLSERIKRHIAVFRPVLASTSNEFLFPGPGEGHLSPSRVAYHITAMLRRGVGIQFNAHLVRHLAATLILDENPNGAATARRLLGQRQLRDDRHGRRRRKSAPRRNRSRRPTPAPS